VSYMRCKLMNALQFLCVTTYMLSAHMLSQFRLSVYLSITWVIHAKTAEVRITKFSPYSSPIPLVFARQISSGNSDGFPLGGVVGQEWGGENKLFSSFMRRYLENGTGYVQSCC